MRGRLTLEKVNAAVGDMATYADANAQLISASKSRVCKNPFYVDLKEENYSLCFDLRKVA